MRAQAVFEENDRFTNRLFLYIAWPMLLVAILGLGLSRLVTTGEVLLIAKIGGAFLVLPTILAVTGKWPQVTKYLVATSLVAVVFGLIISMQENESVFFMFYFVLAMTSLYFDFRLLVFTLAVVVAGNVALMVFMPQVMFAQQTFKDIMVRGFIVSASAMTIMTFTYKARELILKAKLQEARSQELAAEMNSLFERVSGAAGQVATSGKQIHSSALSTAQVADQVANTVQELARGAENQARDAGRAMASANQIAEHVRAMATSSDEVVAVTGQTMTSAEAGSRVIQRAIHQINEVKETVAGFTRVVSRLEERSGKIGAIVTAISNITDQTNLLALNAAIEAARAGEHGRGFAVVAGEVRKLAEQSRQAAGEIGEIITEIQEETRNAVASISGGQESVARAVAVAGEAGESFQQIVEAVKRAAEVARGIAGATHEVSAGTAEVLKNLEQMAAITQETAAGAEQAAAGIQAQAAAVQEFVELARGLTSLAEELEKLAAGKQQAAA